MTNTPKRQTIQKVNVTQNRNRKYDYTTITDRLRTMSLSDIRYRTSVVDKIRKRTQGLTAIPGVDVEHIKSVTQM